MSDAAWQIVGLEGRGRFGAVYRAEGPDGPIALKRATHGWVGVETARAAGEVVRGLPGEVLNAPTAWLRYGDEDWALLPWVEGAPLSAFQSAMPTRAALELAGRVAEGLAALRGHPREVPWPPDLRPPHVRVTPAGSVHLVDLWHGVVDPTAEARRVWMAPEVVRKRPAEGGDVYALGVLVYQALGGAPLTSPETNQQRFGVQLTLALDSLTERGVPDPVVEWVGRLLAFKPGDRPAPDDVRSQAHELARDLGGTGLNEWAPEAIGALAADAMTDPDGRIGARVRDEGPAPAAPTRAVASVVPAATRRPGSKAPRALASQPPVVEPHAVPSVPPAAAEAPSGPTEAAPASSPPSAPPAALAEQDLIPTLAPRSDRRPNPLPSIPPEEAMAGADEEAPYHAAIAAEVVAAAPPPETFAELPPPMPAPSQGVSPWVWAAVVAALLLALGAAWAVLGGASVDDVAVGGPRQPPPAPEPVRVADVQPPTPVPTPRPIEPQPSVDPAPAAPDPAPAPAPAPTTAPAPPAEPRPSAPPPRTRVLLAGDPATVWLIAADGRRFAVPGPVAAGSYTIEATFAGGDAAPAGAVDVPASGQVILSCSVLFARCSTP